MTDKAQRSRAGDLLLKLSTSGAFTEAELCTELVLTPRQLTQYSQGLDPMPLERQLLLAAFVIERIPALARSGHTLRAQVIAATAFEAHDTSTHGAGQPGRFS
jgi:hypothetical protein